jgi:hypothetical protein
LFFLFDEGSMRCTAMVSYQSSFRPEAVMTFCENKGLWFMVILTIAVAGIFLTARPLTLVIVFPDADGLKPDDPVVLQGVSIGKVEDIRTLGQNQIGVTVRIREDHVSGLTHGTVFILRPAALFGLIGNCSIEAVIPPARGTPFSSGERVNGVLPPRSTLIVQARKWSQEYWQQLKVETTRLIGDLQSSPYRVEAKAILTQLKALADQGAQLAQERLDDFRQAHQKEVQDLIDRLEGLGAEMRRKGDGAAANEVEREVERARGSPKR